jgi:hypothetical protein
MLLKKEALRGIKSGFITVVFRKWRRPTVRAGGTLLTPIGQLAINAVDVVSLEEITDSDAAAAGFSDLPSLQSYLLRRKEGEIYRVRLSLAGSDPRVALRETAPTAAELVAVLQRLAQFDSRGASIPWTCRVMELIRERFGKRAADLAKDLGMEKDVLKVRVRKLKGLGLTESLAVGYRLSPRGEAVPRHILACGGR